MEDVDQDPLAEDASALTLRVRLGFETGKAWNTALLVEGEAVVPLDDDYRPDPAVPTDGRLSGGGRPRGLRDQPLPVHEYQPAGHHADARPPAHPARRPALRRQLGLAAERADLRRVPRGESHGHEPGARRHLSESRESRVRPGFTARRLRGRRLPVECWLPDEVRQDHRVRLSARLRADHQHSRGHQPDSRLHVDIRRAIRR